jgi:hypothetical protein
MERKNTNLFFVSGIFLLFTLIFLGRSFKETDQVFLDNYRHAKPQQRVPQPPQWIKNVSLQTGQAAKR